MLEMTPCPEVTRLSTDPLWVVSLDHAGAADGALTGAKASALARAASAGLPVLPGLVVTTRGAAALADPCLRPLALRALLGLWTAAAGPDRALVVRSSSTVEDGSSSSMAGRFQSVLDVVGWDAFLAAVDEVLASAVIEGHDVAPMAVLVQPMLQPRLGGVLFGADPISGRTDRLLLTAVEGGPDQLVSGRVDGVQLALSPTGRRLDRATGSARARPPRAPGPRRARRPYRGRVRRSAGHRVGRRRRPRPAPAEPADHHAGAAAGRPMVRCSVPVPVAETLPGVLAPLEVDLWVSPLRDGVATALRLAGTKSERALARSPDRDGRRWPGGRRPRAAGRAPQARHPAQARPPSRRPPPGGLVAGGPAPGRAARADRRAVGRGRRSTGRRARPRATSASESSPQCSGPPVPTW